MHNPSVRSLKAPDEFPVVPYHRLDAVEVHLPTFLGSRTTVHQASIGCPFRCNFCGVVPVFDREKMEPPERTAAILAHLQEKYGVNAVQFYDNNFFLREDHARELADRMTPLRHALVVRGARRRRARLLRRYAAQAARAPAA